MKSKKHIEDAIKNIEEDREITRELLDDAIKWLAVDDGRHQTIGMTLAKYVETLQRSNEQLKSLKKRSRMWLIEYLDHQPSP